MGTFDKVAQILGWKTGTTGSSSYNTYFSNGKPVFSSFGKDVFASDIVATAVHRVAEAVSKCAPRSVIQKTVPVKSIVLADDEINALFTSRVNPLMVPRDFLYKVAFLTVKNCNCFIYPQFDEVPVSGMHGMVRRVYRGFYPLEAANIKLYYSDEDEMRIVLSKNGVDFDMPYGDIIHIRHKYGQNWFLGGDASGRMDVRGLLGNLQILTTVKECIPKSLEAGLSMKGLLTMRGVPDADAKVVSRDEFEKHILDSQYGIVVTDYESDFTPINISVTDLPPTTMQFIKEELLYPFGVSIPILTAKYTDDDYMAFYDTAVEGILMSIEQGFTAALYTDRQRSFGHCVKVYDRRVQNLSFKMRKEIVEMVKDSALLEGYEQRELLGYEPNGQPTRVSLNFVNADIADAYQLADMKHKAKNGTKEGQNDNA